MPDFDETGTAEPQDMLLHDLRRFLHDAHDQHEALKKISEAMARATGRMEGQEAAVKRIVQALRQQIETGVTVQLDADLKAHASRVSAATTPLIEEVQKITKTGRRITIMIGAAAFLAGLTGALMGVFVALRLL
jgi:Fe-S cluster assembly scaffold protein SufB